MFDWHRSFAAYICWGNDRRSNLTSLGTHVCRHLCCTMQYFSLKERYITYSAIYVYIYKYINKHKFKLREIEAKPTHIDHKNTTTELAPRLTISPLIFVRLLVYIIIHKSDICTISHWLGLVNKIVVCTVSCYAFFIYSISYWDPS